MRKKEDAKRKENILTRNMARRHQIWNIELDLEQPLLK